MKKLYGVLVDVNNGTIKACEIEDSLDNLYNVLDCSTIDIVSRTIGEKEFTIITDDEGLLKDRNRVSAISRNADPMLVGNLFVCYTDWDNDGANQSLDEAGVAHVMAHTIRLMDSDDFSIRWTALCDVGYVSYVDVRKPEYIVSFSAKKEVN